METKELTLNQKLSLIQKEFKASKSKFNSFGKYNFRSAEDILEALKPFNEKYQVNFTITESIVDSQFLQFPMLRSVACINDDVDSISATAIVGIDLEQKYVDLAVNRISRNDRCRFFLPQQIPEGRFEIAQRRQRPIENRGLVIKPEKGFPRHRHALDGEIVSHLQGLRGARVDRDIGIVDLGVVTADGLEGVAHIACR